MAKYLGPKCKQCRRERKKLFLKGERCFGIKCAMIRKPYAPGQHGQARRIGLSEYGIQLREKQKAKRIYGILEKQFGKYYKMASRSKGNTENLLLSFLERRLDNVVYRLGFASSRRHARQMVNHNHFLVNNKKVNVPSYFVKKGDVVSVKNGKKDYFQKLKKTSKDYEPSSWLSVDIENLQGKVVSMPSSENVDLEADIHLVIEFYSKSG